MLDITSLINKIHADYNNPNNLTNNTLRYQFEYNGFITDVFYTKTNGLEQSLRLVVKVSDEDYLIVEHFSCNNGKYEIQMYLDPEIYSALKFTLLFVNGKCSTTPYFTKMNEALIKATPLKADNTVRNYHRYRNDEYKPFFETTIRKHMSQKMRDRIYKSYDHDLATKIIKYCGTTQTLRFTTDIVKSKSVDVYFSASQPINP